MKLQTRLRKPEPRVAVRGPFRWDLEPHAAGFRRTERCPMCRFSGFVTRGPVRDLCRRCGLEFEEHRA